MPRLLQALIITVTLLPASALAQGNEQDTRSQPRRMILLTNGDDLYWEAMYAGWKRAASDIKLIQAGYTAGKDRSDGSVKGQVDKLEQYTHQSDIAAVAVSVISAKHEAIAKAMKELQKNGVVVITVESDIDRNKQRDARVAFLGTDNIDAGQELGKAASGLRPEGGKYATFVGLTSARSAVERIKGFGQGAGKQFESLDSLADHFDFNNARQNVRAALAKHPKLNVLAGIWAYNADAIVQVVSEQGVRDKTTIVVFDATPKSLKHMKDGKIDAMIVQNPYQMGYEGARLTKALLEKDTATVDSIKKRFAHDSKQEDILTMDLRVVVPSKESPLKSNMFNSNTKFYTYREFKDWLDKRRLKGS